MANDLRLYGKVFEWEDVLSNNKLYSKRTHYSKLSKRGLTMGNDANFLNAHCKRNI